MKTLVTNGTDMLRQFQRFDYFVNSLCNRCLFLTKRSEKDKIRL